MGKNVRAQLDKHFKTPQPRLRCFNVYYKYIRMTNHELKSALDAAVNQIGESEWYLVLHYLRFSQTLQLVAKYAPKNSSGLEIGTWPGYLGMALHNLGFSLTGVDLYPERLQISEFPIIKLNLNAEPFPFSYNNFHFVTFCEVIEHLQFSRVEQVLQNIKNILQPGGFVFVTTPNRNRLARWLKKENTRVHGHGHGHEREYSLGELKKLFQKSGFDLIVAKTISWYADVGIQGENQYFYPLADFLKYRNKKRNFIKFLLFPILKYFSPTRDSLLLVMRKPH